MNRERDELDCMLSNLYYAAPDEIRSDIADSIRTIRRAIAEHYIEPQDVTKDCRLQYDVDLGLGNAHLYYGKEFIGTFEVPGFNQMTDKYIVEATPSGRSFKVLKRGGKDE